MRDVIYLVLMDTWPMRWARDMACTSACGFQSLSKITTVSAVARLIPKPHARVLSRNTNLLLSGALKRWIAPCRAAQTPTLSQSPKWYYPPTTFDRHIKPSTAAPR